MNTVCTKCSRPMRLLFIHYSCDYCDGGLKEEKKEDQARYLVLEYEQDIYVVRSFLYAIIRNNLSAERSLTKYPDRHLYRVELVEDYIKLPFDVRRVEFLYQEGIDIVEKVYTQEILEVIKMDKNAI